MRILILASAIALTVTFTSWTTPVGAASEVITHGSRSRPWVALTFDDGWYANRCARIANTLRAKGVTATFLINGAIIRRDIPRWRWILRGFPIANHTLGHRNLTRERNAEIRKQIAVNEQAIEGALERPILKLLRPPYGAYDRDVLRIAASLGYRTMTWTIDSGDTKSGATTRSVIRQGSGGGRGAIILLHCGPSVTPAAVGPIIERYRRRGFRLVDLGEMLAREISPTTCVVRDRDSDRTSTSLQDAVRAASRGDHLAVRGICRGATIGKDLRIIGVSAGGSGPPTLTGHDRRRVLTIADGVDAELDDLTIVHGNAERGGGILNRGTLTLMGVDVRHNEAAAGGGGILNRGSLVVGDRTIVRGNEAKSGGGIANEGTASIQGDSSVEHNVASRVGGGVVNRGRLAMSGRASIVRNEAGGKGGGLFDEGVLDGVRCAPEDDANVHDNAPDDCAVPAPPG